MPLIVIPPKISENPRAASTSASTKGLGGEKHSCCSPAALINFYYSVLVCPPPPSFRPQTACPITRPRFLVLSSKLGSQSQPVSRTQLLPRPYTQLWVGPRFACPREWDGGPCSGPYMLACVPTMAFEVPRCVLGIFEAKLTTMFFLAQFMLLTGNCRTFRANS